jgi:SAM-dependent methyltransferase
MSEIHKSIKRMQNRWNLFSRKSVFYLVSHLQPDQTWDPAEFHLSGIRFADRMCERFVDYGLVELSQASLLEIGCGIGRFLKPLACRFKHVYGLDFSKRMLKAAKKYCACLPNISFQINDGKTLENVANDSIDYCVSAGVFQHIDNIDVIISYIKEALRVLKPGGVFLFQFEGNRTEKIDEKYKGARINAAVLDLKLSEDSFRIREISVDPDDAIKNVVIVLQKPIDQDESQKERDSFAKWPIIERRWLSGVYDDILTKTSMHERQKNPMRLTFHDT